MSIRRSNSLLLASFMIIFLVAAAAQQSEPVVETRSGKLRGNLLPSGRAEFLGIPYAQPPVGGLRWRAPVPAQSWTGVRDAMHFGAPCAQNVEGDWNKHDAELGREDCLYLNVIAPHWPLAKPLPVMFWIHGGANTAGTASSDLYKNGTLVDHGVILVTVNYRLGIFGFFAHPQLTRESPHHSAGNYAVLDLVAALQWVHQNIAKFGGDPNNITVFGQSAGAYNAGLLMASPLSGKLFHRLIGQSGTVVFSTFALPLAKAEEQSAKFADSLAKPGKDQLKGLRALSTETLLAAVRKLDRNQSGFASNINLDGWVFPISPAKLFAQGKQPPIPIIIGNNSREFDFPIAPDEIRAEISQRYRDLAPRALEAYGLASGAQPVTDPLYGSVGNQWEADTMFRCPATAVTEWHAARHHPTYEYQLEHAIPGQEASGSVHSADLPYVFGYFPKEGNISGSFGAIDRKIADTIETYWANFARTGNPNGEEVPPWPEYDGKQAYIAITQGGDIVPKEQLREPQCSVFRNALQRELNKEQSEAK